MGTTPSASDPEVTQSSNKRPSESRRSARTWIIGQGHVDLAEARRWAVEQVEKAEAVRDQKSESMREKQAARTKAMREAKDAEDALMEAVKRLEAAREDLAYRMGDPDEKGS